MNEDKQSVDSLIETLETAKSIAEARFEQEIRNGFPIDAMFFESLRNRLVTEVETLKEYKYVWRDMNNARKGKQDEMDDEESIEDAIENLKQMTLVDTPGGEVWV